jgi:alpha-beta hydrolase superfamily lysophospholipase
VEAFHTGLNTLGIRHQRLRVPYGEHRLNALYFPAGGGISADNRPLIVAHGGLDATLGELYFTIVAACQERGYSALIYEGPGQGVVLREQGLPLIPQWEKPTAAVLDAFLAKHPTGQQIVLLGFSLGGLLALRAAAFDARIDGVATLSAPYDCGDIADGLIPRRMRDMDAGRWLVAKLLARRAKHDPGFRLATNLLPFAMGASDVLSAARNFKEFGLDGAASLIRQPVLIMAGAEDPLVPLGQTQKLEAALSGAASVTPRLYPREMGGAEHCQMGTFSHWQADFFDWLADTF